MFQLSPICFYFAVKEISWCLSNNKEANNSETSRYVDDHNPYFEGMVSQMYPLELQLNKANASDTEAPFLTFSFTLKLMISVMSVRDCHFAIIYPITITYFLYDSLFNCMPVDLASSSMMAQT